MDPLLPASYSRVFMLRTCAFRCSERSCLPIATLWGLGGCSGWVQRFWGVGRTTARSCPAAARYRLAQEETCAELLLHLQAKGSRDAACSARPSILHSSSGRSCTALACSGVRASFLAWMSETGRESVGRTPVREEDVRAERTGQGCTRWGRAGRSDNLKVQGPRISQAIKEVSRLPRVVRWVRAGCGSRLRPPLLLLYSWPAHPCSRVCRRRDPNGLGTGQPLQLGTWGGRPRAQEQQDGGR